MEKQFIISTDSCVDHYKSYLKEQGVHCIVMKRVVGDVEVSDFYDSMEEFDNFYVELKKGVLPTTTQLNPFEMQEYFENILETEAEGDLIHIPLSSGLSMTCANAEKAAEGANLLLEGRGETRRVYVVDSLIATHGMAMLVDKLVEMRDAGVPTQEAIERIKKFRDRQQGWVIMSDLFHLKRGGRIGGFQAVVGSLLGIKPIIVVTKNGKLAIENKMKGQTNAIKYVLSKIESLGEKANPNFAEGTLHLIRTSESKMNDDFIAAVKEKYPNMKIKDGLIVGPIIGTHLGCGASIVLFEGAARLDIKA